MLADLIPDMPSLEGMSERDALALLRSYDADARMAEARKAAVVEHMERTSSYTLDGHRSMAAYLRANLHWSHADAKACVQVARLAHDLDAAAKAIAQGEVGVAQLRELAAVHANPRVGDQLGDVFDIVMEHHDDLEFIDFKTVVRRWEQLADMDGSHRDAAISHRHRHLSVAVRDGAVHLTGCGTGLQAALVKSVIDQYVQAEWETDWQQTVAQYGDLATPDLMPRTHAQRCFDALVAIMHHATIAPLDGQPAEPLVNIVIDAATAHEAITGMHPGDPAGDELLDRLRDDAVAVVDPFSRVCQTIDGFPLPAGDVLAAMWWGQVRKVVRAPGGVVIDLGRTRRLFTGPAKHAVLLQATRCTWPGCRVPIHRCQADHLDEHHRGGPTNQHNAAPLCGHHNRFKHTAGYRVTRDPTTGRLHTHRPDGTEL